MRRRRNDNDDEDNGFKCWGGYMEAKKAKLVEQFNTATTNQVAKLSDILNGIGIYVNGRTNPTAEELKNLMAAHGGQFHTYQSRKTTHIIASNLPNVKIKQLGSVPIVKPEWITDSLNLGKLQDYRKYLLYTNQSSTQPKLNFAETDTKIVFEQNLKPTLPAADTKNASEQKPKQTLTAADPRFLEEFYSNSRLHLISTLGAEFKQLVKQMREKSDGKFEGKEELIKKFNRNSAKFLQDQVIMHIDMDCFFVSVGLRKRLELKGKPVAVTHANASHSVVNRPGMNRTAEFNLYMERLPEGQSSRVETLDEHSSMSEIASCSYEARKYGIKNGMFLGSALKLCPDLKTIPYDFQAYREVSTTLYRTIASYTLDIEAVSCDEMYVDISQILRETGLKVDEWANHIRNEITEVTGCPCSTGFGANRLQARLATKKAKPAGQFHLQREDVEEFMANINVEDIPGVGYATAMKLKKLGLQTCSDVQNVALSVLQNELGPKAGETLKEQASGIDKRPLNFLQERKSVSADVNYGIRFKTKDEAVNFLRSLATEVHARLTETGMRARCLTLKILVRAAGAPVETAKFLGCGVCDAINKSTTTGAPIADASTIFKEAKTLFERINVPCHELRGVGIQLTKLEKIPPVNSALSKFLKQGATNSNHTKDANTLKEVQNESEKETIIQNPIESKGQERNTVIVENNKEPFKISKSDKQPSKSSRGRGRGRGRGGHSRSSSSNANKLNNYFKSKGGSVNIENKVSAKNLDLNVLNELPEYVRKEIIKEYGLEDAVVPSTSKAKESTGKKSDRKQSIFSRMSYEQLKDAIKVWMKSTTNPDDFDVQMLGEYCKELALDRKIEVLHPLVNFLHRSLSKANCKSWHKAYFFIINSVEEGMVARYGNTLLVKRSFSCCGN